MSFLGAWPEGRALRHGSLGAFGLALAAGFDCAPRLPSPGAAPLPGAAAPAPPAALDAAPQLETTRLTIPPCVLLDVRGHEVESTRRCPGLAGYRLLIRKAAGRLELAVLGPRGEEHDLYLEPVTSASTAALGDVATWRVRGTEVSLALPVMTYDAPDVSELTPTAWAIAKVTPREACVTRTLPITDPGGGKDQAAQHEPAQHEDDERLKAALAAAAKQPCLPL